MDPFPEAPPTRAGAETPAVDLESLAPAVRQAVSAVLQAGASGLSADAREALAARFVADGMQAAGSRPAAAAAAVARAGRELTRARERLAEAWDPGWPGAWVDEEWAPLYAALQEAVGALRTRPGVVGVGLSRRRRSGAQTGEPCVSIYVARKRSGAELAQEGIEPLPATLPAPGAGTVPVDVVEVGKLRRSAFCGSGVGLAAEGLQHVFATLGLVATDGASGERVALTAMHLVDGLDRSQPIRFLAPQAGQQDARPLGVFLDGTKEGVDAAKIRLDDPARVDPFIPGIGRPRGTRKLSMPGDFHAAVQLRGAASGLVPGVVIDAMVQLPDEDLRDAFFIRAPAGVGDSGAAVLDMQARVLGLLVGAFTVDPGVHIVCPIGAVLAALGCDL